MNKLKNVAQTEVIYTYIQYINIYLLNYFYNKQRSLPSKHKHNIGNNRLDTYLILWMLDEMPGAR